MLKKTCKTILLATTLLINSSSSYAYENPLYNPASNHESYINNVGYNEKFLFCTADESINLFLNNGSFLFYPTDKNTNVLSNNVSLEPDEYEPNDTMEQAYPYSRMYTHHSNAFVDGFKHSGCHIQGDVDFFWINMVKGYKYDVVLKNLYSKDRHIYIHEILSDGTIKTRGNITPQLGKPEYFTYTPTVSGKHYIEISGEGEPEVAYYYFAVEPAGTIDTTLLPEY